MASSRRWPCALLNWLAAESSSSLAIRRSPSGTDSLRVKWYAIRSLSIRPFRIGVLHEINVKVPRIAGNLFTDPIGRDDLPAIIFKFDFSDDKASICAGKLVDLPFEVSRLNGVARLFDQWLNADAR